MNDNQLEGKELSLIDHLGELRDCLIKSVAAIFIMTAASLYFHQEIFAFIRAPIAPFLMKSGGGLIFTSPIDKVASSIKVAMLSGIVLSTPFWMYQIWRFIAPGLYKSEKRVGGLFIVSGSILFFTGVAFVYYFVFPLAFDFLLNFGGGEDVAMITIKDYLSFFFTTTLLFGFAFELPLFLTIAGMLGFIDSQFLRDKRPYAFVILSIVSALLTPPDPVSMMVLFVPLAFLYEISIYTVRFFGTSKKQQEPSL